MRSLYRLKGFSVLFLTFSIIGKSLSPFRFKILEPQSRLNVFSFIGKSLSHFGFKINLPEKLRIWILSLKNLVSQWCNWGYKWDIAIHILFTDLDSNNDTFIIPHVNPHPQKCTDKGFSIMRICFFVVFWSTYVHPLS